MLNTLLAYAPLTLEQREAIFNRGIEKLIVPEWLQIGCIITFILSIIAIIVCMGNYISRSLERKDSLCYEDRCNVVIGSVILTIVCFLNISMFALLLSEVLT